MVQVRQGKLNFTTMSDFPEGASVLMGTFSINDTPVKILVDSGATHSFVSENLLGKLNLMGLHTKSAYKIIMPGGNCRMDLPGPTTSVGTSTDYSVGPWDYPACATWHLMAWSTRTTKE
jgi:hypothetical protein